MNLKELELTHFKNFEKIKLSFSPSLNCITGLNGMGKTNILDAIHCLCVGKSHFNLTDLQIIQNQFDFARLSGTFSISDSFEQIVMKVPIHGKKILERNGINYKKFADHLGLLPVVMIAPDSTEMITGTGEERRRFMDTTLCQMDSRYTSYLSGYNRILKQRNAHLKMGLNNTQGDLLLDTYDKQLIEPSIYIHEKRKTYIEELQLKVKECYKEISSERETVDIKYQSQLTENDLVGLLLEGRQKDIITQRTRVGIHRDDILIYMDDMDARKYSS
ncbi:MAG TPA: DNA replication and repair protein RecF, partial [Saprospiraceae bacterium]|nr:DNA replication and repair protein RecF [Saprospiraceae bacterium]